MTDQTTLFVYNHKLTRSFGFCTDQEVQASPHISSTDRAGKNEVVWRLNFWAGSQSVKK